MTIQAVRVLARYGIFLSVLLSTESGNGQSAPVFDSDAVEAATTIPGHRCSNSAIGISYQFPEEMKTQDASAMRQAAYRRSAARGMAPEARYFLWGYQERTQSAWLCGAESEDGMVQLIAMPASSVMSQGPNALRRLVDEIVKGVVDHPKSSRSHQKTVKGLTLECADAQAEGEPLGRGKTEVRVTDCAGLTGSYAVVWSLFGYSEAEWKKLVGTLDSVEVFEAKPLKAAVTSSRSIAARGPVAADFRARLDAFMKAWLADQNTEGTMAFFDQSAYSAPPLIGNYCDAWYRKGASPQQAAMFISGNLMGVPKEFPQGVQAAEIFSAWERLPEQWASISANNVMNDHFLVASLDSGSLTRIFSGVFEESEYGKYLGGQIRPDANGYWVVFPVTLDGDIFVIFTVWQKTNNDWKITGMDIICQ